jgi:hypothetical protein
MQICHIFCLRFERSVKKYPTESYKWFPQQTSDVFLQLLIRATRPAQLNLLDFTTLAVQLHSSSLPNIQMILCVPITFRTLVIYFHLRKRKYPNH